MSKEEEFKKSLKEILDSKEFTFDEANWENARQLMDDSRRRKRAMYLAVPFLVLLLSGVVYLFLTPAAQPTAAKTIASVPDLKQAAASPELPEVVAAPANQPSLPAKTRSAKREKTTSARTMINGREMKPSPSQQLVAVKQVADVNPPDPGKPSVDAHATLPNNEATIIADNEAKASAETSVTQQIPVLAGQPEPANPIAVNTPTNSPQQVLEEGGPQMVKEIRGEEPVKTVENKASASSAEENPNTLASNNAAGQNQSSVISSSPALFVAGPDTASQAVNNQLNNAQPGRQLFVEAGGAYNLGWKNPGKTDAAGFNPVVGVLYSSAITKQLTLAVGAQYTSVSNLEYSSKLSKVTRYHLGEESDVTLITPVKLHYFTFPLKFGCQLNRNHLIGLGYNLNYLFNVDATVETYHQGVKDKEDYASTKTSGYTEGFKKFDSQLSIFYRARIYGNLWANAEVNYGIVDVKDDDFFKSRGFERNTGLKLTLLYNFYKK